MEKYMKYAIELANKGLGHVNPNPLVGAVIIKDGKIIGEGYHAKFGQNHAEVNAIKSVKGSTKGATMYVTLEPCSHYGKTPPCTQAIIDAKVKKVIVGALDPNPDVSGNGVEVLKRNGIEVKHGLLEEEIRNQNAVFFKYVKTKNMFIHMKTASTLDGKIALGNGESKWITNSESRKKVHRLRGSYSALITGVNTVINDDPLLNARYENAKSPIKVIIDTNLRTPVESKLFKSSDSKTIIVTANHNESDHKKYEGLNTDVLVVKKDNSQRICLKTALCELSKLGLDSALVEAGRNINSSFLKENLVDKISLFIAPKIIGGIDSYSIFDDIGVNKLGDAKKIREQKITQIDGDLLMEGYLK